MKVWVAGFGNEYREDDAIGLLLAGRVHRFLSGEPGVEVALRLEHQLLPELADELGDADAAVFCDASVGDAPPGFSIREILPDPRLGGFNIHSMGPEWLLALAERVGNWRPGPGKTALLVTVSGERFDFSDTPTPVCMERAERAEQAFRRWWRERYGQGG
jgi:hydrogenase maturation protease